MGRTAVAQLLKEQGYRSQAAQKRLEGSQHPERYAPFQHIADHTTAWCTAGVPVISVDAKKTEWVGDFMHGGRGWHPAGQPEAVQGPDWRPTRMWRPKSAMGLTRPATPKAGAVPHQFGRQLLPPSAHASG